MNKPANPDAGSTFDRDVLTTIVSRGVVLVVGVLQSVVVARYLLPEGRGQYATVMLLPQLFAILAPFGLQWALTYYLRSGEHPRGSVLQTGATLALLLGGGGLLLTLATSIALRATLLAGVPLLASAVAAVIVPVRVLHACWQGTFRGTERILYANVMNATRPALLLLGAVLVLVVLDLGIPALVLAMVAAEGSVALLAGVVAFRGVPLRVRLERLLASRLFSYGIRIYAFSLLLFLNQRIDVALIRLLADFREVGYYVTSVGIAEVLWAVPASLGFVLFPNIVGVDQQRRTQLTTTVCRVTSLVMLLLAVAVALVARPAIGLLYGAAYLPAVAPLWALLPGIVAMALQQVLGAELSSRGRPGIVAIAAASGIPVNVVLNLLWIPRFGALGAALASSVSYAVVTAIELVLCCRLSRIGPAAYVVPRAQDVREMVRRVARLLRRLRAAR